VKNAGLTFIVTCLVVALSVSVAGDVVRTAPEWPDQAYRVEWGEARLPDEVAPAIRFSVPMAVRNNGNRTWPSEQVFVSYHWFRGDHVVVWDGERTPLPHDLRAGTRTAVAARVVAPAEPGSYVLMMTLVHEHVAWFEHKGANTIVRPVVVRPVTHSVD
jgi:hypothetical protein